MFSVSDSITHGGPAVITLLVLFGLAIWGALATGTLRFGRECDYRDALIGQLTKANDEFRAANAALVEANRQQAQSAQAALDFIRNDLVPRLARQRGD